MAYIDVDNPGFAADINHKKEFAALRDIHRADDQGDQGDQVGTLYNLDDELRNNHQLQLYSYQKFVSNFINVSTPYTRLLMKHSTGSGKTIGALSIAMKFIKYYSRAVDGIGSVFVIGFGGTRRAFFHELLRWPQFGMSTNSELKAINKLRRSGTPDDMARARTLTNRIVHRFSNRKANGYFKFIGYKALVNMLFRGNDIDLMSHMDIVADVKSGKLILNKEILDEFKNSLIICDEIHNVYNSSTKNNWGITLQLILDHYGPSVKAVFMSATPINNNPSEIIDLINLLVDKDSRIVRSEFFTDNKLKPGALERLKRISTGRISYLLDMNPINYPVRRFIGESIPDIPYLKFIRCGLSAAHAARIKNMPKQLLKLNYLIDINPPMPPVDIVKKSTSTLAKTTHAKTKPSNKVDVQSVSCIKTISFAPVKWKKDNGIDVENGNIVGPILRRDTLKKLSPKYHKMLNDIIELTGKGKIMIYHNQVNTSGVVLIGNILSQNGYIPYNGSINDSTRCAVCGVINEKHKFSDASEVVDKEHPFVPARYLLVFGTLDKTMIESHINKYNMTNNSMGHKYLILIGSKMIKESYDLKAIQHMMIMSRPDNIPTLIQIMGRAVRKNSHILLPPEMRFVNIRIYVSSVSSTRGTSNETNSTILKNGTLSYEEQKYKDKIADYKTIQIIERVFHENAVDANINHSIIERGLVDSDIGDLKFKPDPVSSTSRTNDATFNAYHSRDEIAMIVYIIKRLFVEASPIWDFVGLVEVVQSPPFRVEYNTKLIDKSNIAIALTSILWDKKSILTGTAGNRITKLFNVTDKRMYDMNGNMSVVVKKGQYYVLTKYGKSVNVFTLNRRKLPIVDRTIIISKYLTKSWNLTNYEDQKVAFRLKYSKVKIHKLDESIAEYGVSFHTMFAEECIMYIQDILLHSSTTLANSNNSQLGTMNEMHTFYYKIIYFYEMLQLVVFASNTSSKIRALYKIMPQKKSAKIKLSAVVDGNNCSWCPPELEEIYKARVAEGLAAATNTSTKPAAHTLPVGHFFETTLKLYLNGEWKSEPYPVTKWVENKTIIGYDVKSGTGITIKFKLRSPATKRKKNIDTRKDERGAACATRSKKQLMSIAKSIGIKFSSTPVVSELCKLIKYRLIHMELYERSIGSNIKYFYPYFDPAGEG